MIHYTYIIGANIELHVRAEYLHAEPDVDFHEDVEIIDVSLCNGTEVEIEGISIDGKDLEELLIQAGLEHTEDLDDGNTENYPVTNAEVKWEAD